MLAELAGFGGVGGSATSYHSIDSLHIHLLRDFPGVSHCASRVFNMFITQRVFIGRCEPSIGTTCAPFAARGGAICDGVCCRGRRFFWGVGGLPRRGFYQAASSDTIRLRTPGLRLRLWAVLAVLAVLALAACYMPLEEMRTNIKVLRSALESATT